MRYTMKDRYKIDRVFVNGYEVEQVFVADTTKGEVWYYPYPIRKHKTKDEAYARRLKGVVTVTFKEDL